MPNTVISQKRIHGLITRSGKTYVVRARDDITRLEVTKISYGTTDTGTNLFVLLSGDVELGFVPYEAVDRVVYGPETESRS